jgi:hypothetical protein
MISWGGCLRQEVRQAAPQGSIELIGEYDGIGTLLRRYVHGPGSDDSLLWYEGAGTGDKRSLQSDYQGSITGIANTNGTLRTINAYDAFGIPSELANNSPPTAGALATPDKPRSQRWACITTRPASTHPPSSGSCKSTPSDMMMGIHC